MEEEEGEGMMMLIRCLVVGMRDVRGDELTVVS